MNIKLLIFSVMRATIIMGLVASPCFIPLVADAAEKTIRIEKTVSVSGWGCDWLLWDANVEAHLTDSNGEVGTMVGPFRHMRVHNRNSREVRLSAKEIGTVVLQPGEVKIVGVSPPAHGIKILALVWVGAPATSIRRGDEAQKRKAEEQQRGGKQERQAQALRQQAIDEAQRQKREQAQREAQQRAKAEAMRQQALEEAQQRERERAQREVQQRADAERQEALRRQEAERDRRERERQKILDDANQMTQNYGRTSRVIVDGIGEVGSLLLDNMARENQRELLASRKRAARQLADTIRAEGGTTAGCSMCSGTGDETCSSCNGAGASDCSSCLGKGESYCYTCAGMGRTMLGQGQTCGSCNGRGYAKCSLCRASGKRVCTVCGARGARNCTECGGVGRVHQRAVQ